jgi:hypothetical protein
MSTTIEAPASQSTDAIPPSTASKEAIGGLKNEVYAIASHLNDRDQAAIATISDKQFGVIATLEGRTVENVKEQIHEKYGIPTQSLNGSPAEVLAKAADTRGVSLKSAAMAAVESLNPEDMAAFRSISTEQKYALDDVMHGGSPMPERANKTEQKPGVLSR